MKKAFTLIELLVVISIIAILAAILFPVFAKAKEAAKATANLSNIKQLALACIGYGMDNDDVFPLAIRQESVAGQQAAYPTSYGVTLSTNPAGVIPWHEAIFPYTKNRDIYTSPLETPPTGLGPILKYKQAQYFGVVPRASALAYRDSSGNYVLYSALVNNGNGAYMDGPFGAAAASDAAYVTAYDASSMSQTQIDRPSDVIMIADAGSYDMGFLSTITDPAGSATAPACAPSVTPSPWFDTLSSPVYVGPWARRLLTGAYAGGKNCVYESSQQGSAVYAACDGSAKISPMKGRIYQIKYSGSNPVISKMFVGPAE
jgi:prepilin-type N-terminal cleavage/methylation domain-containing protein